MRVAVVGLGTVGKRLVHALQRQPDMELAGVAVRSVPPGARPGSGLPLFTSLPAARDLLSGAGLTVHGDLDDLLEAADVVVDCGPSRTGAGRAPRYRAAGVPALYCGGERDRGLGPLVHSALRFPGAPGPPGLRLASCNVTALGRLVAAVGPARLRGLEAVVLRCGTDTDKAGKGITNGATVSAGTTHHAEDLRELVPGLPAHSWAATLPMTRGHVMMVRLACTDGRQAALGRLQEAARITVHDGDGGPLDTSALRQEAARGGRRWAQRFDLTVLPCAGGRDDELAVWAALDNESITVPEALDALRAHTGAHAHDMELVRGTTDRHLP